MSSTRILSDLKCLKSQIGKCEKTVIELIQAKKTMTSETICSRQVNRQLQQTPIAIVGMASLFPQAENLQEYWENILHEVDCIAEVPSSRWNTEDYYDPNPSAPDKTYSKRGGFVPDLDFNPMEFGLPPNLLEVTDVSQLLSLVVAKQALEDSGYGESSNFNREQTGIILGVATGRQLATPLATRLQYPIWERVLKQSGLSESETQAIVEKIKLAYVEWNENAFPGLLGNIVAGRIANRLDLGGMNCTVDAACASSLAAFKMAISELTDYRANLMLTGGVDTDNSILTYLCFSKTPALSRTQKSRPFDAQSDGILLGEGIGMVALKRLEDAKKDGDRIYAVIKGIGTSSDGRFKSIYAPRAAGQVKALERAYQDAGFEPASMGLIEAHGTGTVAGDLTEFEALKQFFSDRQSAKQSIALGSIKSQIGHTKAAAGAASVIKVALALHHKILPPTINIEAPNPKLDLEQSPFYLNTKARPWIRTEEQGPRRAGVSSFGFGGTNFHVLLEEHRGDRNAHAPDRLIQPYRLHRRPASIVLSAATPAQLLIESRATLEKFQLETGAASYPAFVEACQMAEIPEADARLGFIADSQAEMCHKLAIAINWLEKQPDLAAWEHPKGIYFRETGLNLKGKVVALFSGQGSQYLNMGRELAMNFPEVQQTYSAIDRLCLSQGETPISEVVFPAPVFTEAARTPQVDRLRRTEYAQPAIGALSASLFKILERAGLKPNFAAGHSFGELTALWAAKVLSDEDYFALVRARGQAMATPPATDADSGAMMAVKMTLDRVQEAIQAFPQVAIANINAPQQVVLAGARSAIETLQQQLQSKGEMATLLPVAAAFHTPLVAYAQKPFAKAIETVKFKSPQFSVYTNATGQRYPGEPNAIRKILKDHLLNRVQFQREIETIYAEGGYCFIEFGPKATLTNLVKEILGDAPHIAVALNASAQHDGDRQLREAVLQLRVAGLALGNIDPYPLAPSLTAAVEPNKALKVRLGATNYVSEKTKLAFEKALQNGQPIQKAASSKQTLRPLELVPDPQHTKTKPDAVARALPMADRSPPVPSSANGSAHLAVSPPHQPSPETESQIMAHSSLDASRLFQHLDNSLAQLRQHQSETLQIHSQYLNHQMEYAKLFCNLAQQQGTLYADFAKGGVNAETDTTQVTVLQSLDRNLTHFHEHQTQTLELHGRSLDRQTEYARNLFHLAEQQYRALLGNSSVYSSAESFAQPVALSSTSAPSAPAQPSLISQTLAHPPNPAVKTVEPIVFPAEPYNGKSQPSVEPHPGLLNGRSNGVAPVAAQLESPDLKFNPPQPAVMSSPQPSLAVDTAELEPILLAIVSEKTGYPSEMLELEMDMEADLGIDSIKRVEILGALQERFPSTAQPNLEDLAELRTLAQIVAYMAQLSTSSLLPIKDSPIQQDTYALLGLEATENLPKNGNGNGNGNGSHHSNGSHLSPPVTAPPEPENGAYQETTTATAIAPRLEDVPLTPAALLPDLDLVPPLALLQRPNPVAIVPEIDIDVEALSQNLLEIVGEKTGYPVEMLELDMDMEADLGIDSIKRVEILGTAQERFPNLSQPNLEDLAELRTLRQIVEFLGDRTAEKKNNSSRTDRPSPERVSSIRRGVVRLKSLPAPDWLECPAPDVCLLTDDGSTATVELANALTLKGSKVVVLSFPPILVPSRLSLPDGVVRFELTDLDEAHLQHQLAMLMKIYGSIDTFIHLHPRSLLPLEGERSYAEAGKAILQQVFLLAKYLKQPLNTAAQTRRSCFLSAAWLDGTFGLSRQGSFSAIAAGVFGLTKSLAHEWPAVFCRAIDFSPELKTDTVVQAILAELYDPNLAIAEVGYSPRGRATLTC
jgi:polyketide-type polyunsaturated fatty acid synthase PfaA